MIDLTSPVNFISPPQSFSLTILATKGSIAKARTIVVELRQSAEDSLLIGLVSNKSDQLAEEITEAEAHNLAREERLISFDCSAKTGQGVEEIFANLGEFLHSLSSSKSDFDDATILILRITIQQNDYHLPHQL